MAAHASGGLSGAKAAMYVVASVASFSTCHVGPKQIGGIRSTRSLHDRRRDHAPCAGLRILQGRCGSYGDGQELRDDRSSLPAPDLFYANASPSFLPVSPGPSPPLLCPLASAS